MKKLSTHINGLDTLFHGGIQVTSVTDANNEEQEEQEEQGKQKKQKETDTRDRDSLVIIIRGSRGVNKHLFAMQLMHGLGMSIYDECVERLTSGPKNEDSLIHGLGMWIYDECVERLRRDPKNEDSPKPAHNEDAPEKKQNTASDDVRLRYEGIKKRFADKDSDSLRYYSINKPTHLLEDMYLDLLIERWISHTNVEYKDAILGNALGYESVEQRINELDRRTDKILNLLFKVAADNNNPNIELARMFIHEESDCEKASSITRLFADNIIGYNARTNSIHFRSGDPNDDANNILVSRKEDFISEYRESSKFGEITSSENEYYDFQSEFLNVVFNRHIKCNTDAFKEKSAYMAVRNAHSARANFFSILDDIERTLEEDERKHETVTAGAETVKPGTAEPGTAKAVNPESDNKEIRKDFHCEAVVIDGFSHISENDLKALPYTHLINSLRKLSRISILVFEDTQETMPDGDIEIEIRSNYDESEDYYFNELRIAKCVNQLSALGWHLYKRHESSIKVYPSVHLRLFKRSYLNNQMHELGRPALNDSYAMILDTRSRISEPPASINPLENRDGYFKDMEKRGYSLLTEIQSRVEGLAHEGPGSGSHTFNENVLRKILSDRGSQVSNENVLKNILSGAWQYEQKKDDKANMRLHSHKPVTTIVGNLNSFKRNLAMYRIFAKNREEDKDARVLVVLLDKDPEEMRMKMICPGIYSECLNKERPDINAGKCRGCYDRISFLNVNPGCITPEEFLSMLNEHISVYTGEIGSKKNKAKRPLHIVFDDYHRIDFSYPFLSASNLFTTALISLCQEKGVGLTILCDKHSSRVREVCTLSDYVMCVKRDEPDVPRKITLYTERTGDESHASSIIRYQIADAMNLMKCDGAGLTELNSAGIKSDRVGSMREYWRQTVNSIYKSDNSKKTGQN